MQAFSVHALQHPKKATIKITPPTTIRMMEDPKYFSSKKS
jgi:hypothetical protein